MVSGFGFAVEKSLESTTSIMLWLIFVVFLCLVLFLWLSVPFILLSIKKEIKSLKDEIKKLNKDRLD